MIFFPSPSLRVLCSQYKEKVSGRDPRWIGSAVLANHPRFRGMRWGPDSRLRSWLSLCEPHWSRARIDLASRSSWRGTSFPTQAAPVPAQPSCHPLHVPPPARHAQSPSIPPAKALRRDSISPIFISVGAFRSSLSMNWPAQVIMASRLHETGPADRSLITGGNPTDHRASRQAYGDSSVSWKH